MKKMSIKEISYKNNYLFFVFLIMIMFIELPVVSSGAELEDKYINKGIKNIKAGFYEIDITPELGMSDTSFDGEAPKEIKTPLSITASCWNDGKSTVAVVGIDSCVIVKEIIDAALSKLKNKIGLNLLLCSASHTHKGGPVIKFWGGSEEAFNKLEELPPEIKALGMKENLYVFPEKNRGDEKLNEKYYNSLSKKIVEAVLNAHKRMEEVRLINGRTTVEDVGYNRRQKMKNGYTYTHAGKGNPDIVGFAGPVDKEVLVLAAVNNKNKIIGAIVNYACHGTVENGKVFSADWPYYMREMIKKMISPEVATVFLNGCCGDVTQINNLNTSSTRLGGKWPEILGQRVGFAAADAIARGKPENFSKIRVMKKNLKLKYRQPGKINYEKAVKVANTPPNRKHSRMWALAALIMKKHSELYPDLNCELNALQIGNLIILTTPNENFASTGLAIKKDSPFPFTMVTGLTNGWLGYLPTEDVFGPHGGGYEGHFRFGSYLEKKAEQKIRTQLIKMEKTFSPEKKVKRKKFKPHAPWWTSKPEEL